MTDHYDVIVAGSGPDGSAPRLVLVAETDAHEGPVYVPGEDVLYFTTVPQAAGPMEAGEPRAAIRRSALNGMAFSRRLLPAVDPAGACAHAQRHDPRP
jgi:hypothetical protein